MRSLMVGAAVMAMAWAGSAAAQSGPAKPVRGVQLISMGAGVAAERESEAPKLSDSPADAEGPIPADFRVHDLSRRWVEFQMASSFTDNRTTLDPAMAQSDNGAAMSAISGSVPTAPAIPIPLWMRGGTVFAAAAARYQPGCAALPYRPTGFLKPDAEVRRAGQYQLMSAIACEYGIPVGLFDAMIIRESRYRTDALSPKKAFGLTQLMPDTAAWLGVNRYSVEDNLRGGAKYLRQQLDAFGHYHLALAAYNAGPGKVRNGMVPQITETQAFVDDILSNWGRLSGVYRQATILPQRAPNAPSPVSVPSGRVANVSLF